VKVLDFGLAKLVAGAGHLKTEHSHPTEQFTSMVGTTVGTIAYMSPEQARGDDLDPRTDLFSFGVVLYEMATGRQGFPGATTAVIFDGILNRAPRVPSTLNATVPAELDRIISKALEKERSLRYQTANDICVDLQRLKRDSGSRQTTVAASLFDPLSDARSTTVTLPSGNFTTTSVASVTPPAPVAPVAPAASVPLTASMTPAARAASPGASRSAIGAALVAVALMVLLGIVWVTNRPLPAEHVAAPVPGAVAEEGPDTVAATVTAQAVAPGAPVAPTAPLPATVPPSARPATVPRPAPLFPPRAVTPAVKTAANNAAPAAPEPPTPPRTVDRAAERLNIARAKIDSNLLEPALADVRQVLINFPNSTAAAEGSYL